MMIAAALLALFFLSVAIVAIASLTHSLRTVWNQAAHLAMASSNPHIDTVKVEWHDFGDDPDVVELRPRLSRRAPRLRGLRAAA